MSHSEHGIGINTFDTRVFPVTAERCTGCHQLKISGIPAIKLADRFGTPLYVLDEGVVRDRARDIREALQGEFARIGTSATVYYAGKALLNTEIVRWVSEEGLGVDVASGGELEVALAAGADPAQIGFHGNNKSVAEITRAVSAGVGTIIIDSDQEIDRVAKAAAEAGRMQRVRLRVNSGVHASTHDFLATSHEDQKFGVPLDQAVSFAAKIAAAESLNFVGLHCHIGSQIFASDGFRESAKRLIDLYPALAAAVGHEIPELNLGGGFGIAYTPAEAEEIPDIHEVARELADIVAARCQAAGIAVPKVAFEPGRSIVGPAGVTLYTVGTTKRVAIDPVASGSHAEASLPSEQGFTERLYVSVDGGMSDNLRPALYGADYHVRLASRESGAEPALVRVVGKHCESGDIVVHRDLLPGDVEPGDLLAVPATGAYCWSMSSNYNYLPRPPIIAINDGEARMIVRGETVEDLLAKSVTEPEAIKLGISKNDGEKTN